MGFSFDRNNNETPLMGHGHRKQRNGASNPGGSSAYKYGRSKEAAQVGSSSQMEETLTFPFPLPYAHVDSSLRALAAQAEGFGRFAIGGLHGPLYHVTTLAGPLPNEFKDFVFGTFHIVQFSLHLIEFCTHTLQFFFVVIFKLFLVYLKQLGGKKDYLFNKKTKFLLIKVEFFSLS